MVSFRPARDETHITQLLGRMVRTPLARRIPGDERLNAVECLLPFFDRSTVRSVIASLMEPGENLPDDADTGGGNGRRVLVDSADMHANPDLPEAVWTAFESLPSQSQPKRGLRPVKRLTALAQALAMDELLPDAGKLAHRALHGVLDRFTAEYRDQFDAAYAGVGIVSGRTFTIGLDDDAVRTTLSTEIADRRVIDEAYRAGARVIGADIARTYVNHLSPPGGTDNGDDDPLRRAYTTVGALGAMEGLSTRLDNAADELASSWFNRFRVAIKGLTDEQRTIYNDLRSQSPTPQQVDLTRPRIHTTPTHDKDGKPLPTWRTHLLCDAAGEYPAELNSWERDVLNAELAQKGTVAWYRNPSRSAQDSLSIAYRDEREAWKLIRPDFLFFSEVAGGAIRTSIVDPHGTHLADAIPKLRGLAEFAAAYGEYFLRIESLAQVNGTLRLLDLTDPTVRTAVTTATSAEALFESNYARQY